MSCLYDVIMGGSRLSDRSLRLPSNVSGGCAAQCVLDRLDASVAARAIPECNRSGSWQTLRVLVVATLACAKAQRCFECFLCVWLGPWLSVLASHASAWQLFLGALCAYSKCFSVDSTLCRVVETTLWVFHLTLSEIYWQHNSKQLCLTGIPDIASIF